MNMSTPNRDVNSLRGSLTMQSSVQSQRLATLNQFREQTHDFPPPPRSSREPSHEYGNASPKLTMEGGKVDTSGAEIEGAKRAFARSSAEREDLSRQLKMEKERYTNLLQRVSQESEEATRVSHAQSELLERFRSECEAERRRRVSLEEEVQTLNNKISVEMPGLKEKAIQACSERDAVMLVHNAQLSQIAELTSKLASSQEKITTLSAEFTKQIVDAQREAQANSSKAERYEESLQAASKSLSESQNQVTVLQDKINAMNETLAKQNEMLAQLQTESHNKLSSVEQRLADEITKSSSKVIESYGQQILTLTTKLCEMSTTYDATLSSLRQEMKDSNAKLQDALTEKAVAAEKAKSEIDKLQQHVDHLTAEKQTSTLEQTQMMKDILYSVTWQRTASEEQKVQSAQIQNGIVKAIQTNCDRILSQQQSDSERLHNAALRSQQQVLEAVTKLGPQMDSLATTVSAMQPPPTPTTSLSPRSAMRSHSVVVPAEMMASNLKNAGNNDTGGLVDRVRVLESETEHIREELHAEQTITHLKSVITKMEMERDAMVTKISFLTSANEKLTSHLDAVRNRYPNDFPLSPKVVKFSDRPQEVEIVPNQAGEGVVVLSLPQDIIIGGGDGGTMPPPPPVTVELTSTPNTTSSLKRPFVQSDRTSSVFLPWAIQHVVDASDPAKQNSSDNLRKVFQALDLSKVTYI
eukprot:PhF_6_TR31527/c0_g1_i2/m.46476